ncbi:MAG TPA: TfoX/Sxy family protein [Alphaproteobacteria bacterium]|jgi:DNA transformation protein|nr:TfoX/Sxy family protein [Alphaproteobacteria bacterium]
MAVSPEYRAFMEDLVAPLGHVETRRMFGGMGVFYRGLMFILVSGRDEAVYFKVDDDSRADYEAEGCDPFTYLRGGEPRSLGSYYRVPDHVLDDPDTALAWARRAAEAALNLEAAKARKGGRRRPR